MTYMNNCVNTHELPFCVWEIIPVIWSLYNEPEGTNEHSGTHSLCRLNLKKGLSTWCPAYRATAFCFVSDPVLSPAARVLLGVWKGLLLLIIVFPTHSATTCCLRYTLYHCFLFSCFHPSRSPSYLFSPLDLLGCVCFACFTIKYKACQFATQ